jgi:hypothetical protein
MKTQVEVRQTRFPLWGGGLVFGLALLLRLGLLACGPWQDQERALAPDSPRMVLLTHNLLTHGTYGKAEEDGLVHQAVARLRAANGTLPPADENGLRPESFRPPGYPFFLAGVAWLAQDLRWALVAQCLFGAAAAWMAAELAWALGCSPRGSLVVGLLWSAQPGLVVHDTLLLTESSFNFLVVLALFLAARGRSPWNWVVSGTLLGLAGLVRPLAVLYEPLVLAVAWQRGNFRWTLGGVQLLLILLPSGLWAARNQAVGEGFRVSTVPEINLLYYTAAYAISEERGEDWLGSWPGRVEELSERLGTRLRPGEDVFYAARALAVEEVKARPGVAVRVQAMAALKLFTDHSVGSVHSVLGRRYVPSGLFSRLVSRGPTDAAGANWGMVAAAAAWVGLNVGIAAGAMLGLVNGCRRRRYALVLACAVVVLLFTLATGSVGLERMRMPLLLPMLLLNGFAIQGGLAPEPLPHTPPAASEPVAGCA